VIPSAVIESPIAMIVSGAGGRAPNSPNPVPSAPIAARSTPPVLTTTDAVRLAVGGEVNVAVVVDDRQLVSYSVLGF
jgi:hypothetical protein